jgi:hypothetical protein
MGWPDPSGAWVVVSGANSLNALLALAEYVRVGVPGQVVTPYRLGYLPPGARPTAAQVRNIDPSLTNSVLLFGGRGTSTLNEILGGGVDGDLVIQTVNRSEGVDSYPKDVPPTMTIAGHDSWWYTRSVTAPTARPGWPRSTDRPYGRHGVKLALQRLGQLRGGVAGDDHEDHRHEVERGLEHRRLRGPPLLLGARGRPPADIGAAARAVAALSRFIADAAGEFASVDVNPLVATADSAVAVDAVLYPTPPCGPRW